jgi:probable F420-dependent oxidoreductase
MTVASDSHRNRPLRFGLHTALPRGAQFAEFAVTVEQSGFDVMTIPDHLAPTLAPFTGAATACAVTSHLRTGTLVLNNDLRHPVETARETASVAALSGGRFELGLGAGHMKSEYDAAGLKFDDGATRVDRLIESVEVIRPLLAGEPVDIDARITACGRTPAHWSRRRESRFRCSSAATADGCCNSPAGWPISPGWPGSVTTTTPRRSG